VSERKTPLVTDLGALGERWRGSEGPLFADLYRFRASQRVNPAFTICGS